MGFHIVNLENNQLKQLYVQHEDELIDIEFINKDTIIYQEEKNWFKIRKNRDFPCILEIE